MPGRTSQNQGGPRQVRQRPAERRRRRRTPSTSSSSSSSSSEEGPMPQPPAGPNPNQALQPPARPGPHLPDGPPNVDPNMTNAQLTAHTLNLWHRHNGHWLASTYNAHHPQEPVRHTQVIRYLDDMWRRGLLVHPPQTVAGWFPAWLRQRYPNHPNPEPAQGS